MCTPSNLPTTLPYTFASEFGKKAFFTVPTQSEEQYIIEALDRNADASNEGDYDNVAEIEIQDKASVWPNVVYLNYYGKNNGITDTILYAAEVPFTSLTAGAPTRFEFGIFSNL